jgi:hypothetical protein
MSLQVVRIKLNFVFQVKDLKKIGVKKPKVFTLHKDLPIQGGWTIVPLMPDLIEANFRS